MDSSLIARYQVGGDIYQSNLNTYGQAGADAIAAAAMTGDETQVNAAVVAQKFGAPLNTSTASIFLNQLATNPLAAPLADAETVASNSLLDFIKSPSVLIIIGVVLFFWLGGWEVLRVQLKKAT